MPNKSVRKHYTIPRSLNQVKNQINKFSRVLGTTFRRLLEPGLLSFTRRTITFLGGLFSRGKAGGGGGGGGWLLLLLTTAI